MAALNGTNSPVSLGDGITLTAPGLVGNADILTGGPTEVRAAGLDVATPAFDSALKRASFEELSTIILDVQQQPPTEPTVVSRTLAGEEGMMLEVPDLGDTVGQVVLAIDNGVITWNFPQNPEGEIETAASRGAGGQKRFVIRSQVPLADDLPGAQNRGLFGAMGKKILKVLVYPISDAILGKIGEHYAGKWEEKNRPHNVRRFTTSDYQQALPEPLSDNEWQHLTSGRSLLFIHGTFSTAHGGFGQLPASVLSELHNAYEGRIFAFDHKTLSVDPEDNVKWFIQLAQKKIAGTPGLDLDIICHSRGGLVSRALAGELATTGLNNIRVGKVIFVAAPNQGTVLADPDHVVNFLDRYTSALDLAPPGPVGVVSDFLEAILTVVKVFGHAGLSGLDGLASMDPGGGFIARINNGAQITSRYFGMSSNYEPPGNLRNFTMMKIGDAVVDRVFKSESNDLVVPTEGVNLGSANADFPIPDHRSLRFPAGRSIWHSDFFGQSDTQQKLRDWLLPP